MIRKLTLAAGIGAGYVLGAKAGRQRYDQIVAKARELSGKPAVQDFTSNIQSTATSVADKAKDTVNEKVSAVSDKVSSTSSTSSTGSTSGTSGTAGGLAADPVVVVDLGPADTLPGSGTGTGTGTGRSGTGSGSVMPGAAPSLTAPDTLR